MNVFFFPLKVKRDWLNSPQMAKLFTVQTMLFNWVIFWLWDLFEQLEQKLDSKQMTACFSQAVNVLSIFTGITLGKQTILFTNMKHYNVSVSTKCSKLLQLLTSHNCSAAVDQAVESRLKYIYKGCLSTYKAIISR